MAKSVVDVRILGGGGPVEFLQRGGPKTLTGRVLAIVKDFAPIVTAAAGLAVSILVLIYGNAINKRQAQASGASLRAPAIAGLSDPDETKKELSAIALADHREDALPAVRMFLSSTDEKVRKGGVLTASKMYEAEVLPRASLLDDLRRYFDSPSPALKAGVVEVYTKIRPLIASEDWDGILSRISVYLEESFKTDPQSEADGPVLRSICGLLKMIPKPVAAKLLFRIADKTKNEDLATQAYQYLAGITVTFDRESWQELVRELREKYKAAPSPSVDEALKRIEFLEPAK